MIILYQYGLGKSYKKLKKKLNIITLKNVYLVNISNSQIIYYHVIIFKRTEIRVYLHLRLAVTVDYLKIHYVERGNIHELCI